MRGVSGFCWQRKLIVWAAMAALVCIVPGRGGHAQTSDQPETVTIPGTVQSKLGCAGDWQPTCSATFLTYDAEDDVWQGAWELPGGEYEYKVAINQSWDENYGLNAESYGPNIPLAVAGTRTVKFYYDHKTHWVTDNVNDVIVTAVGDFQDELGCASDWDPGCLRSWLQDADGDGAYALVTQALPAGTYQTQVAIDESGEVLYGVDGAAGGAAFEFTVPADGAEIYFGYDAERQTLNISTEGAPKGDLRKARAHWVARDTIAWEVDTRQAASFRLYYDADGGLELSTRGVEGGQEIALTLDERGLSNEVRARFPHLRDYDALKIGSEDLERMRDALKGQLAVSALDGKGKAVDVTGLQIPGVLDDLYTYEGPLGVVYEGDVPTLSVWAPTARAVRLHLFDDSAPDSVAQELPMVGDPDTGVWRINGEAGWSGKYYLYEVEVFVPSTGRVEKNLVTDPYAVSLSMNSRRSQIIDLQDPSLLPEGWETLEKPPLEAPEDIVLYELHVRDFSMNDPSVPVEKRGTFLAFTEEGSNGMQHLRQLAQAGLTHVHLLPVFDIATINENKAEWAQADFEALAELPPDSEQQQAILSELVGRDGYNWGYDPFHYSVPEGSYATDPDGPARILQFRQMVQALNWSGLRVVMDVVYNHTNASGQSDKSVLDRIVPGYYHRLNADGKVEKSTCCENTASEHNMMRKLMVDSVVTWASAYKVDGFRFDLMGHHMREDMAAVRKALDGLTPEKQGVDGPRIYVYGEGWDFGEVAKNGRGVNATQLNVGGLGIGTFNDRMRDAVRGGSPFGGYQEQGFVNGLYYDANEVEQRSEAEQRVTLFEFADHVRIGLSGSLAEYSFANWQGQPVSGADVDYNGSPSGYTLDPQEHICYISAHDNETLFDAIQYKAPAGATVGDRVRMQNMGISLVALSQGVPFFHAGTELLRSKSFDRDSFDSGDWFNRLDFTYQDNNWGVGLPPASKNRDNWSIMRPLLARPELKPAPADIARAAAHFQETLRIRKSSPLFRLRTAQEVQERLRFHNTGLEQVLGMIVMSLSDVGTSTNLDASNNLDAERDLILVVFNATTQEQRFRLSGLVGVPLELHPVQAASNDVLVQQAAFDQETGAFAVPGRTTAVFVAPEGTASGLRLGDGDRIEVQATPEPEPTAEVTAARPSATAVEVTAPVAEPTELPATPAPEKRDGAARAWPWVLAGLAAVGGAVAWVWRRLTKRG